ncbi:rhomboid family intramembrane serine protease [Amycolatopsis albispora]|uniref:Rhomboid family intramembrane serine protease n=1 Tax=Amycolatopsis albispora TaxID=1804986 RepID=A0A344LDC0_9PSEU|nr:rhomboid family intramembrane serine protease [Amycolatopsis albispora]AXB46044.1 rhomboid family intramembrane serine protease [Amycolatopsis albispora]
MTQPPYPPPSGPAYEQALPTCWWHPKRQTGLRCVRCERPACPDCLREASVGAQCVDCVQAGQVQDRAQRAQYRAAGYGARTVAGARVQRPIVTPVLIALNVLVFVATVAQAQNPMDNSGAELMTQGSLWPYGITFFDEWWRLVTSGFLHFGLLHIAMNMLALWVLGRDVEVLLGRGRFLAVYFLSLIGGSAAEFVFGAVGQPTVGASGAIFGLMGGVLIAVFRLKLNPTMALVTIGLNLVLTFSIPNISFLGHLGGFVVGAIAVAALVYAPAKNQLTYQVVALVVLAVALAALILFRDLQLAGQVCSLVRSTQEIVCQDPASLPSGA